MAASRFNWQPPEQKDVPMSEGAEWPKWVYPGGTPGVGEAVLVNNADEEAAAMGQTAEDDIDALRTEAESLGVKIDKRWGAARIRQAIDDHTG